MTEGATMVQALNQALGEEMERDDRVMLLGEDIGRDGGIFRVTEGLRDRFGPERVVDTPVSQAGFLGASIGLAIGGMRPVPEMQFSGFSYYAFHQVESHLSRMRKRSRGRHTCPLVLRMPYGAGVRALEHHSESREAYYAHTPGLKVVIPSTPRTARALLKAAIRDPDPVVFMEPKALYRRIREPLPDKDETLPLRKCRVIQEGERLTMVAYGYMLHRAWEAAKRLELEDGIRPEVIDLQTISPMDSATIIESVKKTGRAVVVHEAARSFGVAAEIIARVNDEILEYLEAPISRVTGFDVHPPLFAREEAYLPSPGRILAAARKTLAYE